MSTSQNIVKKIHRYGLHPATRRAMTFFGVSCVAKAYAEKLKDLMGFSYGAVGAIGNEKGEVFLFNEKRIVRLVGTALRHGNKQFIDEALARARQIHRVTGSKLSRALVNIKKDPKNFLRVITEAYAPYIAGIGVYNCFWRFVGDEENKLSPRYIRTIGVRRDKASTLYPKLEQGVRQAAEMLGKQKKIDGTLLTALTVTEMEQFLKTDTIPVATETLSGRAQGYFYLLVSGKKKELIITNQQHLGAIRKQLFGTTRNVTVVHGQIGYPGRGRGIVYNLQHTRVKHPPKNFILVASATHPSILPLVKKAAAIVTNEGGVLSHAAIVARELKKPCVIGTKIATDVFRDGERVEVDAEKGLVRKL